MAALPAIAIGLAVAGTVVSAGASIYGGIKANEAAQLEGKQLIRQGKEEFAAAQRDALEARLQGKLLQSRQQAVAAASGGGAGTDAPSIMKLMTETGERTDYAAQVAMYQGESKRRYYTDAASAARTGGQNSLIGSVLKAVGTLAGGLGDAAGMVPDLP